MMVARRKRGISIVGTLFTLILLGVLGAGLVSVVAMEQESRMRSIMREDAFHAVQAGLEFALREIKEGGYPIQTGKALEDATFTTSIDQNLRKITVSGTASSVSKVYSITTAQLAKDCTTVNTGGATAGGMSGNQLLGITFTKACLNAVNIDKVTAALTPDLGERLKKVRIGGVTVYDDMNGVASGTPADITDSKITGTANLDFLEFSSSISGKTVGLTFLFTDSSTKVVSVALP